MDSLFGGQAPDPQTTGDSTITLFNTYPFIQEKSFSYMSGSATLGQLREHLRNIKFMQVETTEMFSPDGQLLNNELDGQRLKDLGVSSCDRFRVRSSNRMAIFVKLMMPNTDRQTDQDPMYLPDQRNLQFIVRAEDEVGELKSYIAEREGFPVNSQRIIFAGK